MDYRILSSNDIRKTNCKKCLVDLLRSNGQFIQDIFYEILWTETMTNHNPNTFQSLPQNQINDACKSRRDVRIIEK